MRVRVKSQGQLTGSSSLGNTNTGSTDSIEGRILQARDTLFEEELYHELVREARVMAGHGITKVQDVIHFSAVDGQEVLLDLVDVDEESPLNQDEARSHEDDRTANAIFHTLHILLAFAHRQNHRRRTQIPAPLSQRKPIVPEYQLLRPIMAYIQHTSHVRWLESFFQGLYKLLKAAGLSCEYTATSFSSVNLARHSPVPKIEALADEVLRPLESTFSGSLITPQNSITIKVRTNLFPPFYGTHYDVNITLPEYPQVQPPAMIGLRDEVAAMITHVVLLDLVSAVSTYRPQVTQSAPEQEGAKQEAKGLLTWKAAHPHHGELLASSSSVKQRKKMKIGLSRTELTLQLYDVRHPQGYNRPVADMGSEMRSNIWKPDTSVSEQRGLMDVVAEVSKL